MEQKPSNDLDMALEVVFQKMNDEITLPFFRPEGGKYDRCRCCGSRETAELGKVPGMSQIQLHADAALNAFEDAGISARILMGWRPRNTPTDLALFRNYATWVDGTAVGGCSFMLHVRHLCCSCYRSVHNRSDLRRERSI